MTEVVTDPPATEIVDGRIVPLPDANPRQSVTVGLLWRALLERAPEAFDVSLRTDVRLRNAPLFQRRPDVVVLRRGLVDVADVADFVDASDVALVVEVESQDSAAQDRWDKPAEYAAARIPHYWRVESRNVGGTIRARLHTYALDPESGSYRPPQEHDRRFATNEPFAIDLAVQGLLGRR